MKLPKTQTEEQPQPATQFEEGIDYYYDGALMVLTAKFLLERGHCCGSGCRHCPYLKQDEEES